MSSEQRECDGAHAVWSADAATGQLHAAAAAGAYIVAGRPLGDAAGPEPGEDRPSPHVALCASGGTSLAAAQRGRHPRPEHQGCQARLPS